MHCPSQWQSPNPVHLCFSHMEVATEWATSLSQSHTSLASTSHLESSSNPGRRNPPVKNEPQCTVVFVYRNISESLSFHLHEMQAGKLAPWCQENCSICVVKCWSQTTHTNSESHYKNKQLYYISKHFHVVLWGFSYHRTVLIYSCSWGLSQLLPNPTKSERRTKYRKYNFWLVTYATCWGTPCDDLW